MMKKRKMKLERKEMYIYVLLEAALLSFYKMAKLQKFHTKFPYTSARKLYDLLAISASRLQLLRNV